MVKFILYPKKIFWNVKKTCDTFNESRKNTIFFLSCDNVYKKYFKQHLENQKNKYDEVIKKMKDIKYVCERSFPLREIM